MICCGRPLLEPVNENQEKTRHINKLSTIVNTTIAIGTPMYSTHVLG